MRNRAREVYSHGHHDSVLRSHSWRTAENSAAYLLPWLKPADRLLDVGVGPGTITVDFAERLSDGSVVGIDLAPAAVSATQQLAAEHDLRNLSVSIGDVYDVEFPDASFDVVHAHQVLQHLSDPIAALREMRRVCLPGGIVAVRDADWAALVWYPPGAALTRWHKLYHQVSRANGGEPKAGRRLLSWARAAGFRDVNASASAWCFATPADVAWWAETWAERLSQSDFGKQAVDRGLADSAELAELAAAWLEWGQHSDAWFSVLHGELVCRR
ncbi:MAG TPA: methyltransferase domain-containing protein [Propionibacteriaceae bacterium]|nr:methyltransferase domain-containing protein [Propionibacteriaceae bacterium]